MRPAADLDALFLALANPTRRALIARLRDGEASVMELAAPFELTQPAISKHLEILERVGLVSQRREGQRRPRRLEAEPLAVAAAWLERYRALWEGNFERLDALLLEMEAAGSEGGTTDSGATQPGSKAGHDHGSPRPERSGDA